MSSSNVCSRDSETTFRSWVTGESSSNRARRWSSAAKRGPKCGASCSYCAAASAASVSIPSARSLSAVFGPMPGTSAHREAPNRAQACSRLSTTKPLGFSASEATLATSLLGPIPIEQPRPVPPSMCAARRRIAACGAGRPVRSRYASSSPMTSTASTKARTLAITSRDVSR